MSKTSALLHAVKLLFNLQHPTLEECYLSGYEAALTGFNEEENPYSQGTKEFSFWLEGWWTSFYEEESWFELPLHVKRILKQRLSRNQ